MLKYDFHDSIPYFVFTAAHAIEKAMGAALEGHGITFRQCQMLGMLAAHGSLSQAQVAEMMGVEPSSVARLVDRMTRDGWIERRPDPHDRRKYQLFATDRAEPIWEGVQEVAATVRNTALEGLDEGDVPELKRMLRHLRNNLTDDPGRYPDTPSPDSALSDDCSALSDDRAPAAASASR
ncbi:MarR family winged helix-turn-helix transcriptional regulator [Alienimonas californiensis]|uniref:Putative HTH-type transcriptional regulator YusO n=1 Tax=Alienimonas californiensis TaxID=2527989 RepID=A0A517P4X7_9PLAN|nr:MarR family transcriptional regulator [Alienimonas californiensis]QDT14438.1 putative HTH-type transcriptional regulator YusO [Alienimonas californiensis]